MYLIVLRDSFNHTRHFVSHILISYNFASNIATRLTRTRPMCSHTYLQLCTLVELPAYCVWMKKYIVHKLLTFFVFKLRRYILCIMGGSLHHLVISCVFIQNFTQIIDRHTQKIIFSESR